MSKQTNIPSLRFPEFSGEWEKKRYNEIYSFYSTNSFSRDNLNYDNGAVKNIHYGDIHTKFSTLFDINKELVPFINSGIDISKIKEENYCIEGDLVIADASEDYNDIGKTIEIINLNNVKTVAGLHTFLARPNKHKMALGFSGYMLQSDKVRKQVKTIAQGTKVLGLTTGRLGKVELYIPDEKEQQKIASFLTAVDSKIELLQKKKQGLEQYKKGVMQQIFTQQLRFKKEDGTNYPDWEEKKLGEVLFEHKTKNVDSITDEVFSVAKHKGVINQIEHLGRSYSASTIEHYKIVYPFDVIYTKSPTSDFPFGIIKQNLTNRTGVVSPLYVVLRPVNKSLGFILHNYFMSWVNTYNYLSPLVQKGAKNTMNINNDDFLNGAKISLPNSEIEQAQIANFLSAIDDKIALVNTQLENTQQFKKGLLQQMFV